MSDDEHPKSGTKPKVISLDDFRRKPGEATEREYLEGNAFRFMLVEDPANCVGTTESEVVFLPDPESAEGLAFTPEGARDLGVALIEVARFLENGWIPPQDDSPED